VKKLRVCPKSAIEYDFWNVSRAGNGYIGGFPKGLLARIKEKGWIKGDVVVNLFGGFVGKKHPDWLNVDINKWVYPTIIADSHHSPLKNEIADTIILDPPYDDPTTRFTGAALYGVKPLSVIGVLKEAIRIAKAGTYIILLHFLVPPAPKIVKRIAVIAVWQGPNHRIRALSVYRKNGISENTEQTKLLEADKKDIP